MFGLFGLLASALTGCGGSSAAGGGGADAGLDGSIGPPSGDDDGSVPPGSGDGAVDAGESVPPPIDDADTPVSDAGPGGPWIAFASTRGGNFDLYLIHPDGTGLRPLVQDPGADLSPAWSPDGARVAFTSNRSGAYLLYVVDVASGVVSPITTTGTAIATSPAFSPDGATIAFGGSGPGGGLIYKVAAAGGQATPLTTGSARDSSPVWATDGSALYFATDRAAGAFEVWTVKLDGTGLTQVTTGAKIIGGPAISPDGTLLAFAQVGGASGAGSSTQIVFESLATKASVVFSAQSDAEPAFAKNGRHVAMTSTRYDVANPDIVILDADGGAPFRLTQDPGVDGQAAYQPFP